LTLFSGIFHLQLTYVGQVKCNW